jgi:hypothetical protein
MSLTQDQIDPERLSICDFTGRLDDHNGTLGVALAQWAARDDSQPDAYVTRAGNTAIDSIDAMLRELHQLRGRLIDEQRVRSDLAGARVDALLGGK